MAHGHRKGDVWPSKMDDKTHGGSREKGMGPTVRKSRDTCPTKWGGIRARQQSPAPEMGHGRKGEGHYSPDTR